MDMMNLDGVSGLTAKTQELIKQVDKKNRELADARFWFRDWSAYRERTFNEIEVEGGIKNVDAFNKTGREYMKQYLETYGPRENIEERVAQFQYEGHVKKYQESLKNYFSKVKEYKGALKKATKAVIKEEEGTNFLDNVFEDYSKTANGQFKQVRKLKIAEFGLPTGAKVAIGVGIAALAGLAVFGAVKAFQSLRNNKTTDKPQNNTTNADNSNSEQIIHTDNTEIKTDEVVTSPTIEENVVSSENTNIVVEQPVTEEIVTTEQTISEEQPEDITLNETETEVQVTEMLNSKEVIDVQTINTPVQSTTPSETRTVYEPITPEPYVVSYEQPVAIKPETTVKSDDAETRAAKRAAFEEAVKKIEATLTTEGIQCDEYTTVKNDTLWKISKNTLIAEGIEKPSHKEIIRRIALIAVLNNIENVNMLRTNQTLKVPSAELNAYIESNPEIENLLDMLSKCFA